ncbi:phosphoglycerate dehydrogenase [Carnobacterium gallinarum]|uniref:phosphoglycerate dehydrogenase n=1 Tax=Carnobacterium gallinarum TaxID=2749 RepID=UPI00054DEF88|nr:phosphoglycerate dehydrogenase [Carnobacterium gallinarum]
MKNKGIWLLQTTTPQQLANLAEIAPTYELIQGAIGDFPAEKIEIVYGWNQEKAGFLLDLPDSQLKWIQAKSAGVDTMDLTTLAKLGITLTNGSGIHGIPIAESVFGMLLAYTRGIKTAIQQQSERNWQQADRLIELRGKTMMILGTGQVGEAVGNLAKGFGLKTIGVNRSGGLVASMDYVIKQSDVPEYLQQADIVVNILPLTSETTHYYNDAFFQRMKKEASFINVGRGPSVDTEALIRSIQNGQVAFAGLDVFEEEPLPLDSPLWTMPEVLVTPHTSGIAEHFKQRLFAIFAENLRAYVEGDALPRNVIDYQRSY